MSNKEKYRILCEREKSIPLFSKSWWLDAVAPDNWEVILIENGEEIISALPYVIYKKAIFNIVAMPILTPITSIWIKYPNGQKYLNRLAYQKEIYEKIIERLPNFDYFEQNFDYSFENWLPFYWNNFKQTTKYTYVIEDLSNLDELAKNFRSNTSQKIRKASKIVDVYCDNDIEKFYNINKLSFERQNMKMPYSLQYLKEIDNICNEKNCRKVWFAEDKEKRIHSALYLVWDSQSAYYLMGGGDPELRNSGAMPLLVWEAIKFASTVTQKFDFEGSMIKPIETFFSGFGGVQKPYFQISKTNSQLLKLRNFIKKELFV